MPPISQTTQDEQYMMRHSLRSKDELRNDIFLTIAHGHVVGRPVKTHIHQLCADTGCSLEDRLRRRVDKDRERERERERERGERERVRELLAVFATWRWLWSIYLSIYVTTWLFCLLSYVLLWDRNLPASWTLPVLYYNVR